MSAVTDTSEIPDFMLWDGKRLPIAKQQKFDIRSQVMISSCNEKLMAEIRWAYLLSDEIRALYHTFDMREAHNRPVHRALQLTVSSTNKYTHIEFPNCPQLKADIHRTLQRHACELIGHDYLLGLSCKLTVPRLGCAEEQVEWSADT